MGSGEQGVPIWTTTLGACAPRLWTLNEIAWPIVPTGTIRFALPGVFAMFSLLSGFKPPQGYTLQRAPCRIETRFHRSTSGAE